ncbi:BTB/POZ domain-containing protein [Morus notabilis]|uniref:BTB/POZ domain-containing protein n=1 Tax=Morus notabilis TaxID=981085 RepID=W9R1P2_9ROSA|nr:BTB/POZ domain-containing protein At5g17580 [Morus notabilis]EXB36695.1 BTB/POZ domain-containing protein [Morus notabilis]
MANRKSTEISTWITKPTSPSETELFELMAFRCAKIAFLLKERSLQDLSHFLAEIPANPETFELVARFCAGYDVTFSAETVVPLSCLAHYLGMTEAHRKNNLLKKALLFLEHNVLPIWNETVKAFRATENIFDIAIELGLVAVCANSIITKTISDPQLLGDPIKRACFNGSEDEGDDFRPNVKRRLFAIDWPSEDLTTLSLRLYEPLICEMVKRGVPLEYVTASLCNYVRKWVLQTPTGADEKVDIRTRNSQREIVEAVERLLPNEMGLVPCNLLFEMLRCTDLLEASSECMDRLELRIGKNLNQATVKDLLTLSQGYAGKVQYDVECVRRILTHFYRNYNSSKMSDLIAVAELVEELLAEIASDRDLKIETFTALAEMSKQVSNGCLGSSDGMYKGIDIYLDTHRDLLESEREKVCQVLDIDKMSPEACEHAAKNERLPTRVVLQALFVTQVQLRNAIMKEIAGSQDGRGLGEEEEEDEEATLLGSGEESMRSDMEKISKKMMELERECCVMKREIEKDRGFRIVKKEKVSLWKEMKRKIGCINIVTNCNRPGKKKKKVHP